MSTNKLASLTAWALMVSGVLIIIKKLVVDAFLPVNIATHAIGTFGVLTALFALTGIYLYHRGAYGLFGWISYVIQWFGLGLVAGVDYARNYILPYMSKSEIKALLAGPTLLAFVLCSLAFLLGVILFGSATWRARVFSPVPTLFYMIGFSLWSLSFVLPAAVGLGAQILGSIGIVWFGVEMRMQVRKRENTTAMPLGQPARA